MTVPKLATPRPRSGGIFGPTLLGLALTLLLSPSAALWSAEMLEPILFLGESEFASALFSRQTDGARMVLILASAAHESRGLDAFLIDETEITQRQYLRFVHEQGASLPGLPRIKLGDDHPVVGVPWSDAAAYCAWAGSRLPSEMEWQRAGGRLIDGRSYPWGEGWNARLANSATADDGFTCTAPVGSFPEGASPFGVFDLAGNAEEWVAGELESGRHVALGGSWRSTEPEVVQLDHRSLLEDNQAGQWVGFRCAADAPPSPRR